MKYDPILCMMVDDSVKMEDASWKAWSLYIDGKFVKAFNSEMPPIKEAKTYMKENYPNKVAKLSRNTGSASGYTISAKDSKTVDEAIRSCDRVVVKYDDALGDTHTFMKENEEEAKKWIDQGKFPHGAAFNVKIDGKLYKKEAR